MGQGRDGYMQPGGLPSDSHLKSRELKRCCYQLGGHQSHSSGGHQFQISCLSYDSEERDHGGEGTVQALLVTWLKEIC
jgi:hypothetical protein